MNEHEQAVEFVRVWAVQRVELPQPVMDYAIEGWGVADVAWPEQKVMLQLGVGRLPSSAPPLDWKLFFAFRQGDSWDGSLMNTLTQALVS